MVCKLSALRGEADVRDRVTSTSSVAIDPQETLPAKFCCDAQQARRPECGSLSSPGSQQEGKPREAARVHHANRWCSGRVAARGTRAAAGDARGRIPECAGGK